MQAQSIPQQQDPNLAAEQQQAQNDQISTLQTQAQNDTATLMARYGTKLALSGMSTPATTAVAAPTAGVR
jgi:hypothetical protein